VHNVDGKPATSKVLITVMYRREFCRAF